MRASCLSLQFFAGLSPLSAGAHNSWLQRPVGNAASPAGQRALLAVQCTSTCKPRGLEKCSGIDTLTGSFPTRQAHEHCRIRSLAAILHQIRRSPSPAVGFKLADLQCGQTAKPPGISLIGRCASPSEAAAGRRGGNSKGYRSKRVVQAGDTLAMHSEEQEMEVVPRPPITVIATDVDGTLLDSKQQLRAETVAALKAAMARGVRVLIATGKARGPWIDTVLPQLGLATPGVYMQGLILYDGDGSILFERYMDEEIAKRVIRLGAQEGVTVTAYCGNRILCAERDKHTDRLIGYGEPVPEAMGSLLDVVGKVPINKLLYMGEQSDIDAIRPEVQAALGGQATLVTALNGMLEVLPLGASKGLGLQMVLERMGVDPRNVMAVGDGENDIEMLRLAGTGVAMGNAGGNVKEAAEFVTDSNDENGLALALDCFVLGGLEAGRCCVTGGRRIRIGERAVTS